MIGEKMKEDNIAKKHLSGWSNPTLFLNKPITRRIFSTDTYEKSIDTHYRFHENKNRKFYTSVQDINILFHYLKLILEMEQNGLEFTKKKIDNPKKLDRSVIGKDIIIDKRKYVDWDLDQVLKQPFSKWWKKHKSIFGSAKVNQSLTYEILILNYNIMVRYLNGQPNFDIFLEEKNRIRELRTTYHIDHKLDKKIHGKRLRGLNLWNIYTKWWGMRNEPNSQVEDTSDYILISEKVNLEDKLINASEQIVKGSVLEIQDILLGVCEGAFVKKIKLTYDPKTGKRGIPKL